MLSFLLSSVLWKMEGIARVSISPAQEVLSKVLFDLKEPLSLLLCKEIAPSFCLERKFLSEATGESFLDVANSI